MGENTKIEWPHHTFNPIIGCTKKSEGCKNCYAEEMMDHRYGRAKWGANGTRVRTSSDNWKKPYTWNRKAAKLGERHRVFCASLSDVFEEHPAWVEPRRDLLKMIAETPHLDWLLLTKRPENVLRMIEESAEYLFKHSDITVASKWLKWLKHGSDYMPNVWAGASVENQKVADQRIPELLKIPAAVRFLSMEPLLGPVNSYVTSTVEGFDVVTDYLRGTISIDGQAHVPCNKVNWVIAGGESGTHARPMHPDWARSIRDECVDAGTPFLFKQWGEWQQSSHFAFVDGASNSQMHRFDDGQYMAKVGKHNSGRLLDGQEWNQFPK